MKFRIPKNVKSFLFIPDEKNRYNLMLDKQFSIMNNICESIIAHELGHLWFHLEKYPYLILKSKIRKQDIIYERDLINTLAEDALCDSMAWARDFEMDKLLIYQSNHLINTDISELGIGNKKRTWILERVIQIIRLIAAEFIHSNQKKSIIEILEIKDKELIKLAYNYYNQIEGIIHKKNKKQHKVRIKQALSCFYNEKPSYFDIKM